MRVFHEDFTRSGESVVFIHSKVMALVMENEQVLKDGFDTVICHAQTTDTKILNKKQEQRARAQEGYGNNAAPSLSS